ncbi:hypothetical protein [Sphingomonas bacterium]|uniref:hypothetical protein n=1 Tax=Sphingomonas bacterium TaxID=1895847 RepID=UPI0015758B07|nr:hypothetical protein [Sphingomonas bacterium]
MRHIALPDFQANAEPVVDALDAGEEVLLTARGRHYRLSATPAAVDDPAVVERRRRALADLKAFRSDLRASGVRVTREEVRDWISEGRR